MRRDANRSDPTHTLRQRARDVLGLRLGRTSLAVSVPDTGVGQDYTNGFTVAKPLAPPQPREGRVATSEDTAKDRIIADDRNPRVVRRSTNCTMHSTQRPCASRTAHRSLRRSFPVRIIVREIDELTRRDAGFVEPVTSPPEHVTRALPSVRLH